MIREKISKILKYTILEDENGPKWDQAFTDLGKEGRITEKHIIKILIELLKAEEIRERK